MSDVTICRACGLPRFHGPAGYAGAQCLCQWKGATLPQMYDELMAKSAALEAENTRLERLISHWQSLADDALAQLAGVQRLREALSRIRDHAARVMDDEVFYEADSALSNITNAESEK